MLLVPPAHHQAAQPVGILLESLEGLPEAMTDRHASRVHAAARKAGLAWAREAGAVLPRLSAADQARIQAAMGGIHAADARAAAESALDASDVLLQLVPEGRSRELRRADQDGMRAWIGADAGRWESLPDLDRSFAWLMAHDEGRHTKTVREVEAALRSFAAARDSKSRSSALHEIQRLLDLVDELER